MFCLPKWQAVTHFVHKSRSQLLTRDSSLGWRCSPSSPPSDCQSERYELSECSSSTKVHLSGRQDFAESWCLILSPNGLFPARVYQMPHQGSSGLWSPPHPLCFTPREPVCFSKCVLLNTQFGCAEFPSLVVIMTWSLFIGNMFQKPYLNPLLLLVWRFVRYVENPFCSFWWSDEAFTLKVGLCCFLFFLMGWYWVRCLDSAGLLCRAFNLYPGARVQEPWRKQVLTSQPWVESRLFHLLLWWLWASWWTSLSPSVLICKMGIIITIVLYPI